MTMLSTLAFVVPFLASGATNDWAAGSQFRAGGGYIPISAVGDSEPGAEFTWTLLSGFRHQSPRTTFLLTYTPRVYLRRPNVADLDRPLLLHQLASSYATTLSRRTSWSSSVEGRIGEVSYISVQEVFDPGTGAVTSAIVPLATVTLRSSIDTQTSRRNALGFSLTGGYRAPLGARDGQDEGQGEAAPVVRGQPFPATYNVTAQVNDGYALSQVTRLGVVATLGYFGAQDRTEADRAFAVAGSELYWARSLSPRTDVRVAGGVTLARPLATDRVDAIPSGSVNHQTGWKGGGRTWQSSFTGGVRGFFDPVSVTYRPQVFGDYGLRTRWGRAWQAGVSAFASTSLAASPLVPARYETFASLQLPVSYTIRRGVQLQFGVRSSARGPHPADIGTVPFQEEYAGFVGIRGTFGTDRDSGSWL